MASTFLLILLPLILAAAIGAWVGSWWTKRHYEDVTESFEMLQSKARSAEPVDVITKSDMDDRFASLSSSFASIPAPDFDPLHQRLSNIESTVSGFSVPETDLTPIYERMTRIDQRLAQPNAEVESIASRLARVEEAVRDVSRNVSALHNTDLEPLQARFEKLDSAIDNLDFSVPDVDLGPVHSGIAQLELAIAEIDLPPTDLGPIQEQLTGLEMRVVDLAESIDETRGDEYKSITTELGSLRSSFAGFALPDLNPVAQRLGDLEKAVTELPVPDLETVEQRLSGLEDAISGIQLPETDFSPLQSRLERLETRLSEPSKDYQTLFARLAGMEAAVDALDRSPVDLGPINGRIAAMENLIAALRNDIHGIPKLESVERQLAGLQQAILSIPQPDLSPVVGSLRSIDGRLDMGAVENRLTSIEYGLTAVHHMLRSRPDTPAPVKQVEPELYARTQQQDGQSQTFSQSRTTNASPQPKPAPAPAPQTTNTTWTYSARHTGAGTDPLASARRPDDEANLLTTAAFGEPDDLERISGVGPMLSGMLKDIGVFYFWQIAEWDTDDIVWVDGKLEHFKGRIERDNWVGQSQTFAAETTTADRPSGG